MKKKLSAKTKISGRKKITNFVLFALVCSFMLIPLRSIALNLTNSAFADIRTIVKVESISVNCPVGTVPRLPYMVWVTYSDGTSEYRQTRWSNSALATEQAQANPTLNPVGTEYTVGGFIIGDNTTSSGFPITANVRVVSGAYAVPSNVPVAETVPLNKVTINGDNRLTSNRDRAIDAIVSWDVAQQLYNYRDTYGLSTEGYPVSNGWDSPTTKLKGHGSGHYMSALAFAFAGTTNPAHKNTLRNNMSRMVNELRECQERTFVRHPTENRYWEARDFAPESELREMLGTWAAFDVHKTKWTTYGYGYINAIPAHHAVMIEMYRAYNNVNWIWAPYYSIHKQLAGLIDIATYVDDPAIAAKALLIAKDMGLWIWNRLHYRTFSGVELVNEPQDIRRANPGNRYEMWNISIAGEDGGTGESLARLSEMVTDPIEKARLLEASNYFDGPAFYDPLSKNIDDVRTRHANQHIPKITSALRSFRGTNNPYHYNLSVNFWDMIQGRYRYAPGGVGNDEMWKQPYSQMVSMTMNPARNRENLDLNTSLSETCCAYNLAKLTKDLNCYNPDDAKYMDYYERVLYNQLVGSLDHSQYRTTYHYAISLNSSKRWGNHTPQSTCCGGTGSENHVKYQEATYFVSDNTLWVGLYMPTTLAWDAKNLIIQQDCLWPAEKSTIKLTRGAANFTMKLRVPYWATNGFDIKLNGVSVASDYRPSSYVTIPARNWTTSDVVEIIMPFDKHIDFGPDKMERAITAQNVTTLFTPMWAGVFMYGPLAMATIGVTNWDEATIDVNSNLDDIILNGPSGGSTGPNGNLYTLTHRGRTFLPDYYRDANTTHYFRINFVGDPGVESKAVLFSKLHGSRVFQPENYTPNSYTALRNAFTAGEQLHQNANATEAQITSQIAALDAAIKGLVAIRVDKNALLEVISEAESRSEATHTWDSYANLRAALATAKQTYETSEDQTRIDMQRLSLSNAIYDLVVINRVNKSVLREFLDLAKERKVAQEAWNALAVKVPEHPPWAQYGFARLLEQLNLAQKVNDNEGKNYNQTEVDEIASSLNVAINTMRPGNLPETEELSELLALLRNARTVRRPSAALTEAIAYTEMVVDYVTDGSGTRDMIETAHTKLTTAIKIRR